MLNVSDIVVPTNGDRQGKLRDLLLCVGVFVFAILLYVNTFHHGWVLDDSFLFKDNKYVTAGLSGWKDIMMNHSQDGAEFLPETFQYRPVSQLLFALEWEISPNNTTFYHVMNVLWNAVSSVLLFVLLRMMFKRRSWIFPLLITLIFTANPMHTEVVANIKSRDELCYFLFLLLAIISALKYFENGKKINLLWLLLSYTLSFFSKESAITALVAIPLFVFFFGENKVSNVVKADVKQKRKKSEKHAKSNFKILKPYINILLVLLLSTSVYLGMRYAVLSVWHDYHSSYVTLMQNYLADQSLDIRLGSAIFLMGKYLLLAFVPYMQSCDYSFAQLPYVGLLDWRFILVFLVYVGMLIYVIHSLFVKRGKSVFVFCILFWITTMSIYSNTVYLIGSSFADRFLFVPVLASAIVFVELLAKLLRIDSSEIKIEAKSLVMTGLSFVVICLFSTQTVLRAADWKDPYTLYKADAPKVPESARIKFYLGDAYRDEALQVEGVDSVEFYNNIRQAMGIYSDAISINPDYSECYERLGFCYLRLDHYYPDKHYGDSSIFCLDKSIKLFPYDGLAYYNRAEIAYDKGDYQKAKDCYSEVLNLGGNIYDSYFKVGNSYYELGIYDTAMMYYIQEIERDSTRPEIYYNLGFCYSEASKSEQYSAEDRVRCVEESIKMYDKAIEKFPNLFVAYSGKLKSLVALGRWSDVIECGRKAIEVNPDHDDGYFYSGVANCQLNKYDEAERYFNEALKRNPNNYIVYFNLAYVYSLRGDMHKAESLQQRGEQLQQNNMREE
ncbi:MAG: tetratricopeptide repeat protein [Bacteroidales bacterium]|nr:tetratricopeptide repeat protein [Bacteroidales bacterium]